MPHDPAREFRASDKGNPSDPWDEAEPLAPRSIQGVDVAQIPRRRWVYGRRFIRGAVTVTVAPPGMGKSMLSIHEAIAVAAGIKWAGHDVHDPGPVWLYNNEELTDELHRRLFAALGSMGVDYTNIQERMFINSGDARRLLVATKDESGAVVQTPDVAACINNIKQQNIALFVVDPFIETHTADENSNEQMKEVATMFREIAQQADCAVNLIHHTRKPPAGSSEGHAGNMDTARGASSLIGVAAVVDTMFSMSDRDGERLGIAQDERHKYLRLDAAKVKYSLRSGSPLWFKRDSVIIANKDEVGVLTPVDLSNLEDQARADTAERHRTIIARLLPMVPNEMTLNKAGLSLIEQDPSIYPAYRGKDFNGKCPSSVRREIEAAAESGIAVNDQTFHIEDRKGGFGTANRSAKVLVKGSVATAGQMDDDISF